MPSKARRREVSSEVLVRNSGYCTCPVLLYSWYATDCTYLRAGRAEACVHGTSAN